MPASFLTSRRAEHLVLQSKCGQLSFDLGVQGTGFGILACDMALFKANGPTTYKAMAPPWVTITPIVSMAESTLYKRGEIDSAAACVWLSAPKSRGCAVSRALPMAGMVFYRSEYRGP